MKSYKPTSPSRRSMTTVDYGCFRARSRRSRSRCGSQSHGGRNSAGRITMRHQGNGNKKLYRMVDFKQNQIGAKAVVETLEYDPYRTAFIARVKYADGKLSYILAPEHLTVGTELLVAEAAPLTTGNRCSCGTFRSAIRFIMWSSCRARADSLPVRPVRMSRFWRTRTATPIFGFRPARSGACRGKGSLRFGQVSNAEWNLVTIGKAGRSRWLGIRPTVRGKAMNPVDHPYGGGEGSQPRGTRKPKDIWGNITGGHKTRNKKKRSTKLIIKRRK